MFQAKPCAFNIVKQRSTDYDLPPPKLAPFDLPPSSKSKLKSKIAGLLPEKEVQSGKWTDVENATHTAAYSKLAAYFSAFPGTLIQSSKPASAMEGTAPSEAAGAAATGAAAGAGSSSPPARESVMSTA